MRQQVVGEFRHQHMRQQACVRDALVDYLGRHRRLDQRFALPAGPLLGLQGQLCPQIRPGHRLPSVWSPRSKMMRKTLTTRMCRPTLRWTRVFREMMQAVKAA